jgi:alpha-beta hydrolase superfamily lysophospholipase
MMGMVQLAGKLDLGRVTTPVLVIYSPEDRVVRPRSTEAAFAALGSTRKQIIPYRRSQDPSQHVLAGEILSPDSTAEVAAMIVRFVAQRP